MRVCPGTKEMLLKQKVDLSPAQASSLNSELRQWPVQLHLVGPMAPYFQHADVLLVADCVTYTIGDFHKNHLAGHSLAIACPKLDSGQEAYREKLTALVDEAEINSLTVMIMQVPCCRGLESIAKAANQRSTRKVPLKAIVVGVRGEILQEGWIST